MTINPPTGNVGALVVGFEVGGLVVGLEVVGFIVGSRAGLASVRTLGWEGGGDAGPTSEMREKYL